MSKSRQLSIVGALALFLFVFGFGTEAWGDTHTWIGKVQTGVDYLWSNPGNWDVGTPHPGDDVVFSASGASNKVTVTTALNLGSLKVLQGVSINIQTTATITVSNATTLEPGGSIDLGGSSIGITALQLNGLVDLQSSGNPQTVTQIYSDPNARTRVGINLGSSSTLQMGGDLRNTYFGSFVDVHLYNTNPLGTAQIQSSVRFNDDVYLNAIISLDPNYQNIWLDVDADLIDDSGKGYYLIKSTVSDAGTNGLVIKNIDYWCDLTTQSPQRYIAHNTYGPFTWLFGAIRNNQTDVPSDISIQVNQAWPESGWYATPSEPFPGVGVRIVDLKHPMNSQIEGVLRYWVVQPIGLIQDYYWGPDHANNNKICVTAEYYPNDASKPELALLARYSDNYSDWSGTSNWYKDGATSGTNGTGRLYTTMCETSGFGDFTIEDGGEPLPVPVELTSFSARVVDNQVRLNWETATELNNYGFYVERSVDRENWKEVDFVPGCGTSYSPKNYVYFDELGDELQRMPELSYRLRQVDRDGTTDYSNIVNVNTGELPDGVELYAAYPNPFNPATTISFAIGTPTHVTLKVYNTLGQAVATILSSSAMDAGLHTVSFDGAQLPSGVYLAVLEANGAVQHQKLVLNK